MVFAGSTRLRSRAATSFFDAIVRKASSHTIANLIPVDPAVETKAEPSAPTDIWWSEESIGLGRDEFVLGTQRSSTPQVSKRMVVVTIEPQRQELTTGKESRRSVTHLLRHAGQAHADCPDPSFKVVLGHQRES